MDGKVKMTPKDFFLYVAVMVALYVSAFSLIKLLFEYIDVLFPDRLDVFRGEFNGTIRFSIASLIIIFPIYLALTTVLNKDIRRNHGKRNIWIRKWVIYLTMFVAGITIITDLVILVNGFLGGEIVIQFALKMLSILVVTGAVFGYYLYDIRGVWEKEAKKAKTVGWTVAAVVLIAVVSGFFIIGTPVGQRLVRFDQDRIEDLQTIQWQIVNFWQNKERLPESLSELLDPISGFALSIDAESGEHYGYKVISDMTFELCANFNKESVIRSVVNERIVKPVPVGGRFGIENNPSADGWQHGEGEKCFERTIDPDLYPVRKD